MRPIEFMCASVSLAVGDMGLTHVMRDDTRLFRLKLPRDRAPENLESTIVLGGVRYTLREEPALSTMGTAHFLNVGNSMGMFVVMIATKVSRTAQEAAS